MKSLRRFAPAGLRVLALSAAIAACLWMNVDASAQAPDASATQQAGPPVRITQAINENNLILLRGNVHPLARPEFDQGPAPPDLHMDRMLLVLKRSPAQEAALQKLLDDQQDKSSPSYHRWLTPEQFAQQFGVADSDIQTVTSWLQSHGFRVTQVSKGRTLIEFSGTATQVQEALHTSIRKYVVNETEHWANTADPQIPSALSPVVAGVFTLHNFYKMPQSQITGAQVTAKVKPGARPEFTSSNGQHALLPADYYTIYNFSPLQISTGAKIAIVGRSNINLQDVTYFHFWTFDQAASAQVIVNGPDPGDLGGGEEGEAVLDTTWAGAVAPTAWLALVVSASTATTDGVDLSELYIIDNNLADVMSESFGDCESNSTSAEQAGIVSLAQQAAAQGITYVVSAGDSGAAGCDDPHTETLATHPVSVNVLASTPYTVAVGGTMFNENGHSSSYWSATNTQQTLGSAISYIPEDVWNEACISGASGCTKAGIWAGGGGASTFITKPSWQAAVPGIPSDGARDLPDVSLTAAGHDPYLLCLRGSCVPNAQGQISFAGASGTSASTPAFAGIMALVGQKTLVRLGQPNYVLYRLAAAENLSQCNASSTASLPASSCVFNDVTVGNNAVPGESGYGTSGAKYPSGIGYDQATGLGSMNVAALINQWNSVTFNPTTTTFSISPTTATHGDPLNVSVDVTPNSGTGMPSGTVWLLQSGYPNGNFVGGNTADTFTLGAQGTFTGVTHLLPGGTYQVNTHYAGDGTYAGSDSTPPVQVTIQPENTTITFSVLTTDASGNFVPFTGGPYGSPVFYQAHVAGQSGYGTPGAHVNFYDNNGFGSGANLDKQGNALTPVLTQLAAGTHSITAAYYGDNSFNTSANLTPINFTISQIPTITTLASQQTTQSLLLTAIISASGTGSGPTGLVTFSNGGSVLATNYLTNGSVSGGTTQSTATFDASQLAAGQYSITASYAGDANYIASNSSAVVLNLMADFGLSNRGAPPQTVTAGQTAQFVNNIAVAPFFGFSSTVNLSCTVPASATTCSVNPNSLTTSSGVNIASVAVTTTARGAGVFGRPPDSLPLDWQPWPLAVLALLLCMLLALRVRTSQPRFAGVLALALVLFVAVFEVAACGGGSSAPPPPPPPPPQTGTAAGSYTVTVTATASTNSVTLTHTTTLNMIVQ